jgi:hypothetical protein
VCAIMGRVCFPADCSSPAEEDKFPPPAPLLPKDPADTGLRVVVGDGDVLDAICLYGLTTMSNQLRMRKGRLYTRHRLLHSSSTRSFMFH